MTPVGWRICRLGLVLSPEELYACEFLEANGRRFAVDYGTLNCEQLAVEQYVAGLEQAYGSL